MVVCLFVLFLLVIVLSVLLRYMNSDYLPLVSSNSSYGRHHDMVNRYDIYVQYISMEFLFVVVTIWSFPHSLLITELTTRVTRRVALLEHELHPFRNTSGFQWDSCCSIISFLCSVLQIVVCLLDIILSVLLRLTDSDNSFGIVKLVLLVKYVYLVLYNMSVIKI